MLLAFDTATRLAGLALYDPAQGQVLSEEMWHSRNNHTVELMPRLVRVMDQQGLSPSDLSGLVAGLGPGSFTGLRIGLGVAKGLAVAQRLPIVGVPTLDAVARPHMVQQLPIRAILRAGRSRICAGLYALDEGRWRRKGPFFLGTLEELCSQTEEDCLFCGEIDSQDSERIQRQLGSRATIVTPASAVRRAAYLAELGWERLSRGDSDDVSTLSPIYLQHPPN
ncbi:tRNA (adenosine(37)-N6)-threonylcarbamoyltransferase complex dimerization subunit type 1 TsaB [Chloroflexota bacterium]